MVVIGMAVVKPADLINKFLYAYNNKWGYILGKWHTQWTAENQNSKISYMKNKYGANWKTNTNAKKDNSYTAAMYGDRWIGNWVTDCSGLFYWAFKELGGYMYHGSNTMWKSYCTDQGKLNNGKRSDGRALKPGTAVFTCKETGDRSHVGLYIGNSQVIEASGTQVGVIMSSITNTKWNEWGELKGVDYEVVEETNSNKHYATVNATRVALRSGPGTSYTVLTRVDKDKQVEVIDEEWTKVTYQGKTGYMMTKFLNL